MFYLPNYVFYIFLSPKGRTGSNKIFIGMPIIPYAYAKRNLIFCSAGGVIIRTIYNMSGRVVYNTDANVVNSTCETLQFYRYICEVILKIHLI